MIRHLPPRTERAEDRLNAAIDKLAHLGDADTGDLTGLAIRQAVTENA